MFPCDASTLTFQRIDEDKKILIARTCFLKRGEKQVWREILHKISSSSSWKTKTNIVFVIYVLSNWTNSGCGWKNFVDGQFTTKPKNRINWESQLNIWWEVYRYITTNTIKENISFVLYFLGIFSDSICRKLNIPPRSALRSWQKLFLLPHRPHSPV